MWTETIADDPQGATAGADEHDMFSAALLNPSADEHGEEESIDFDRVLVDLTPPAPTPGFADELPRVWFRHFGSPRLYRLGRLLSKARLGRHVVLAHLGYGRTEQLQVEVRVEEGEPVVLHVDVAGQVSLHVGGDLWLGLLDRAGEAGLARFTDHLRRLVTHIERYGVDGIAGVLRAIGLRPQPVCDGRGEDGGDRRAPRQPRDILVPPN
jgi:hypothetical protein